MYQRNALLMVLVVVSLLSTVAETRAQVAYTTQLRNLFRFDLKTPGTLVNIGPFTGAATNVNSLDYRPFDGLLYGYDRVGNQIVTIDPATAFTTFVYTPTTGLSS